MSAGKEFTSGMRNVSRSVSSSFGRTDFRLFFDRNVVMNAMDRRELRVLSRTGSFGRGSMRRLFRSGGKKGKSAGPGQMPRYHTRGFVSLMDGVFFTADLNKGSVMIGPNKLRTKVRPYTARSGAQLLNEGGRAEIMSWRFNKPIKRRVVSARTGRRLKKRAVIRTRPGEWKKRPGVYRRFVRFTDKTMDVTHPKFLEILEQVGLTP